MNEQADDWVRTRELFERLCDAPVDERHSQLAALTRTESRIADEVRALLAADAAATVLDRPADLLHLDSLRRERDEGLLGRELGGYRLTAVIGEGGTATVFRGVACDGALAAIKVLKASVFAARPDGTGHGASDLAARFEAEHEVLQRLRHPGILAVFGAGTTDDGRSFLVTELIDGSAIDRWCDTHALDVRARLRLFVRVCHAVHHAHQHLVVHRDLKPSNILVDATGQPRVLDFGVAKLLEPRADPGWTSPDRRAPFTAAFASPEQVRGLAVTTASDVYSLGVLLYHLLLGHSPYRPSPAERSALELAVCNEAPRAPSEFGATPLPRDLAALLATALRKDPGARYPSAEHLADDVCRYLEHRPLRTFRQPPLTALLGAMRRRPITSAVVSGAGCLLLGGLIALARDLDRVRTSEAIAWRAHAHAVVTTRLLADLLEQVGATGTPEQLATPLRTATAHVLGLTDAPEAEARLRLALAQVQLRLGQQQVAHAHLVRALELSRTTRGLSWRDADQCLHLLIELALDRGDPAAVTLADERRRLRRDHGAAPSPAESQLERAKASATEPR